MRKVFSLPEEGANLTLEFFVTDIDKLEDGVFPVINIYLTDSETLPLPPEDKVLVKRLLYTKSWVESCQMYVYHPAHTNVTDIFTKSKLLVAETDNTDHTFEMIVNSTT